jgi:hypothetical protein
MGGIVSTPLPALGVEETAQEIERFGEVYAPYGRKIRDYRISGRVLSRLESDAKINEFLESLGVTNIAHRMVLTDLIREQRTGKEI